MKHRVPFARSVKCILVCTVLFSLGCTRAGKIAITALPNPAAQGSITPNETETPGGEVLLSWLEPVSEGLALRFATRGAQAWSAPQTAVTRNNFDKYAEAPPWVLILPNRSVLAVWSEKLPQGKSKWAGNYLYTSASSDQGKTWSEPAIVHSDRTDGEHSFASLAVSDNNHATVVWLDARDYDTKHTYRLMSAVIASTGAVSDEQTVDDDVCTCCPTALVKTPGGFLAAYRNHTPQEIRDIYTVREEAGAWKTGRTLHNDNWNINGCPVNGAALARRGEEVVAVWYSGMEEKASVQVEFSPDGGATFADNTKIDSPQEKEQPIGRPTVALPGSSDAWVAWIRRQNDQSQLVVAQVRRNQGTTRRQIIAEGSTESLGYPRMQLIGSAAVISWGGAGDSKEVKTALIARR
jgi:hypothetical protein